MAAEFILCSTKHVPYVGAKSLYEALPEYEDCMTEKFVFTCIWTVVKIHIRLKDVLMFWQIWAALSLDFRTDSSAIT